jgi:hypothetical protein
MQAGDATTLYELIGRLGDMATGSQATFQVWQRVVEATLCDEKRKFDLVLTGEAPQLVARRTTVVLEVTMRDGTTATGLATVGKANSIVHSKEQAEDWSVSFTLVGGAAGGAAGRYVCRDVEDPIAAVTVRPAVEINQKIEERNVALRGLGIRLIK